MKLLKKPNEIIETPKENKPTSTKPLTNPKEDQSQIIKIFETPEENQPKEGWQEEAGRRDGNTRTKSLLHPGPTPDFCGVAWRDPIGSADPAPHPL